jgi:hypothetical protein
MIRAVAALLSLALLSACVTSDQNVRTKAAKLRNAHAAATPIFLGTGY